MTTALAIGQVALSAQRNLHQIAAYERSLRQRGAPVAAAALSPYRAVERARLDVCAEHLAALQPANDLAFEQNPEHA
ncbi:hypothetical protein [Variovorax paradoxus]|uniref:hypothetical protein n=1 Tax=Variovorax paradoxus TaxID=34073 RepID=UPI003D64F43B